MEEFNTAGQTAIEQLSEKHGFSRGAVASMLTAMVAGNGSMAQFQHPEFGGSGQWMRGGMMMLSDMFNHSLKARVDGLCQDLSGLVSREPHLLKSSPYGVSSAEFAGGAASAGWWGADLGHPSSTGSQNHVRYAYFPQSRRLAIDAGGTVTIYDTLDHQIGGVSQQQSHGASLSFTSQHGPIRLEDLPVVSGNSPVRPAGGQEKPASSPRPEPRAQPEAPAQPQTATASPTTEGDVFATLERLAQLHSKGILTDEEFAAKKAELLGRL